MKNLIYATRQVFKPKSANLVKLLSLALSLLVSGTLAARVSLNRSSDGFYPDVERLYRIESKVKYEGEIYQDTKVMSPLVVSMRDQIPQIESATRCMPSQGEEYNLNGKFFKMQTLWVDSLFFDVLGFEVLSGDPRHELNVAGNAFISSTYADMIFPKTDPVGRTLILDDKLVSIRGVFADIPVNCHLQFDIVVAPDSFLTSWEGGDRYWGYFKLHPGSDPTLVDAQVPSILADHIDLLEMRSRGIEAEYHLMPIKEVLTRQTTNIDIVMSLLALVLIIVGGLNYVLLTISSLVGRAREIGIHKANGATARGVFALLLWETAIYVGLAVILMALLLLGCRSWIEEITSGGYGYLFSWSNIWSFVVVVSLMFLVSGVIPAWSFARIGVTQIFRRYTFGKNDWKQALLFVQFLCASFIISFMMVIFLQYKEMVNRDLGYDTHNVGYVNLALGSSIDGYQRAAHEIARLPFVDKVALANSLPMLDANNGVGVNEIGSMNRLVSCGQFQVEPRFFDLMGIPIIEGRIFELDEQQTLCVIDQMSAEELATKGKQAVGFNFLADGELQTVCGVAKNVRLGSAHSENLPIMYTNLSSYQDLYLVFKLKNISATELTTINDRLKELFPNRDFNVVSYDDQQRWLYLAEKQFLDVVMVASFVLLLVTIMGVVGYMASEIRRRSREIAIRKVFGSTSREITTMLLRTIVLLVLTASIIGATVSYIVSSYWQEQFALKATIHWWIFALSVVVVIMLVIACVLVKTWPIAREKPAVSIKSE